MKLFKEFFILISFLFIFSSIILFIYIYKPSRIINFQNNQYKPYQLYLKNNNTNKSIHLITNNAKQYLIDKPVLISSESDSFIYKYKSQNYYGKLDITDYQPPNPNFKEFQKPQNVNIKGYKWEESQFILSFVFPVFNKVTFLERSFRSLLNYANNPQKNPENEKFEIVIVDANSDDGSYEYSLKLAESLNKLSTFANEKEKTTNQNENEINNLVTQFLTGNKKQNLRKKSFRYRHSYITFHDEELNANNIKKEDNENSISNVRVRVVRRNEKTLSVIARQIGVEYSTGRYIWQIDPDDEINTKSLPAIIDEIKKEIEDPTTFSNKKYELKEYESIPNNDIERKNKNDPPADMIDIGYCQYTYDNGVLPDNPNCIYRYNQRINSNYEIAKRLVTETTTWQLWQCIIKRDTFLKAIETIKLHSPNQTKIIVADDLFIYSAAVYHSNVLKEVNLIGYIYYYMNQNSESLKIYKENLNTRLSAKTIVTFMHYLFDEMKLSFNQRYSEL
ncbi:hypothetical protein M9Y10_032525 [Tritrichomonas musculus]|uniref:Glycosyltransferase 2-like domain-containing protein n=1 Tax=Tritrichomonas musculus TaxID=1915356 RepID=A0ABR2GYP6_9EUKA